MTSMKVINYLLHSWLYTEHTQFFLCQQTLSDIYSFTQVDLVKFAIWYDWNITVYNLLLPAFYRINARFHSEVLYQTETRLSTNIHMNKS